MRSPKVLDSLPEGYEVVRGERGLLVVERASRERLLAAGFGPDGGEELGASDLSGRARLGSIDAGSERWVVRRFQHGGLVRILGERFFLDPDRPFRELLLSARLRALEFRTPRVVAARALRSSPLGWSLALVSARVEGVEEAAVVLEGLRRGERSEGERRRLMETLGELIGRLHAAGFAHADLNPRNLLLTRGCEHAWVLDLDRGRLGPPLSDRVRRDNLRRLYRAVRLRESRGRSFLRRADYLRFLQAYDGVRGDRACWRADWRSVQRTDRLHAPWHGLGWLLEGVLGAGPANRDGAARVG